MRTQSEQSDMPDWQTILAFAPHTPISLRMGRGTRSTRKPFLHHFTSWSTATHSSLKDTSLAPVGCLLRSGLAADAGNMQGRRTSHYSHEGQAAEASQICGSCMVGEQRTAMVKQAPRQSPCSSAVGSGAGSTRNLRGTCTTQLKVLNLAGWPSGKGHRLSWLRCHQHMAYTHLRIAPGG